MVILTCYQKYSNNLEEMKMQILQKMTIEPFDGWTTKYIYILNIGNNLINTTFL